MQDNSKAVYSGDEPLARDEDGNLIDYYAVRPNKSQVKRDMVEIAQLAEKLTQLAATQLAAMALPENIETAIMEAKAMPATKPARKRQLKFIAGQLRKIELSKITQLCQQIQSKNTQDARQHQQLEQWRDKLIASKDNAVLTALLSQFPTADAQYLRQLRELAQKEAQLAKPPKSARALFHYLKTVCAHKPLNRLWV